MAGGYQSNDAYIKFLKEQKGIKNDYGYVRYLKNLKEQKENKNNKDKF